ncbi:MFS transporter [Kibdelosporangium philippinense]|uniref:MFS transporter n=1 Tax=Kibdelosporangium philippinense TaxID=211113 RepID=A0ABS8ZXC9_9PSEU|nr:MFS transporter [Kibdelosporangium philippinense]MCE7011800.1 MFS transporter [Kibdelosporangium philippinense]
MGQGTERVTFGSVLAVSEFRAMWAAELLSIAGDQLARVALSVLVFQRTDSAFLTGLTYALTFVPALVGGILLSSLGDQYPRRDVMVAADLARAVLVGLMVVPGIPLWLLCVLVAAMTLLNGPFKAAQQALLPDVLTDEKYTVGMAIRNITSQSAQLVGFAGGGALVSAINPPVGLALDATTFLASALVLRRGVRHRPAPTSSSTESTRTSFFAATTEGARLVWRDPGLRVLIALCWLAGFYVVPEALAAPYADGLGAGAFAVGLIMASDPVGSVIGGIVFGKWVPERVQIRVIGVLGVLAGLPLVLCVLHPGLITSMALFALSGMFATAYNIQGTASFVRRLPDAQRAQGSGLLSSGLITVQGLGALAAGALADQIGPAHTIALAGFVGAIVAIPIAVGWSRARPARSEVEESR